MQNAESSKLRNSAAEFNSNPTPGLNPVPNPNPIFRIPHLPKTMNYLTDINFSQLFRDVKCNKTNIDC